ncbi:MAG TPA: hypothetical protein K8V81_02365 [Brachybacterium massiliense]|uniref:Uncharacterized protein n=1 Tax=Brachybacterium massiliense TaxID=1755098 RepID=A0A921SWG6_9MICO|nr:hypothetical protein [Brachybacterium massiliense]
MIAALLKHEWLRTRSLLGSIGAVAVLLVAAGTALTATGWPGISLVGMLMVMAPLAALVPATQIALAVHYWQSSYSRTGYFTQSLPLSGVTIYAAKLAWALLVSLLAVLATAGLLMAAWPVLAGQLGGERNPFSLIRQMWEAGTAVTSTPVLIAGILLFLGLILIWPIQYFFAASVGSETPLNRLGLGGPVVVFLGLYLASQVLVFLGMAALPWGLTMVDGQLGIEHWSVFAEIAAGDASRDDIMPVGFVPMLLLIGVVCLLRTVHSWRSRVSLV